MLVFRVGGVLRVSTLYYPKSRGDIIKTYITKVADQRVSISYFYEILNYLNPEIQQY